MAPTRFHGLQAWKREDKKTCDEKGCEEMPVSNWQKSGIPIIIGVALFIIAFVVLFLIVRKRRKQNKQQENDRNKEIDMEDLEIDEQPNHSKKSKSKKSGNKEDADDFH